MSHETALQAIVTEFTTRLLALVGGHAFEVIDALHTDAVGAVSAAKVFPVGRGRATRRVKTATKTRGRKVSGNARAASAKPTAKGSRRTSRTTSRSDGKSSPTEVVALGEKIVALLAKSERHLATREILKALGLPSSAALRLQYALGKVKESGAVKQYGERGGARYGVRRP